MKTTGMDPCTNSATPSATPAGPARVRGTGGGVRGLAASLALAGLATTLPLLPAATAQEAWRGLGIAIDGLEVLRRNETSSDEPYVIVTQFLFKLDLARARIVPESIRVNTVMNGHDNLGRTSDDWATQGGIHRFTPVFATERVPRREADWFFGTLIVHMEEDAWPDSTARQLGTLVRDAVEHALRTMNPGALSTQGIASQLDFGVLGLLGAAVDSDDSMGRGLVILRTLADDSVLMKSGPFDGRLPLTGYTRPGPGTRDVALDFQGDGHHRLHLRTPVLVPLDWTATPASGMGDVDVGPDGTAYFAGLNGTLWSTFDRTSFDRWEGSGFANVAVNGDGTMLWAAGANGTLWGLGASGWSIHPHAINVADVTASGPGSIVFTRNDGSLWNSVWGGAPTRHPEIARARRVDADPFNVPWITQIDGSVIKRTASGWLSVVGPDAGRNVGVEDISAGALGNAAYVRRDGVVWLSPDGITHHMVAGSGFKRVDLAPDNRVWAVGANGTVWHFDGNF